MKILTVVMLELDQITTSRSLFPLFEFDELWMILRIDSPHHFLRSKRM